MLARLVHQLRWLLGVAALLVAPAESIAQGPANVLVVANAASAESTTIAEYYCSKRKIPHQQLLRLTSLPADPADGIDRAEYERRIQAPIAAWLGRHQAQDQILYIVLTKGIPLRINGGRDESTAASVDSELTLLYARLSGAAAAVAGPLPNPYFLGDRPITDARAFRREDYATFLVARLDGFTVADVLAMIDRAAAPATDGRFVLDGKASLRDIGNNWLRGASERLAALGVQPDRIGFDESAAVLADQAQVLGYYSWGSNDPAIRRRDLNLEFRPGAIGGMFVSTDGRTFREPPADWTLPAPGDRRNWFAGTPQSLAGDLIRAGITGISGHVAEPLLRHTIRPDILFPAYLSGFTLAESFYLAMPSLSWMTVVVGDPLCAPFGKGAVELPPVAIDPETELPEIFSRRRLETLTVEAPVAIRQRLLRAQSRIARDDTAGARDDLEHVVAQAPDVIAAQFQLATLLEALGDTDAAIARYRTMLERVPDSAVALNNLAYALAVKKGNLSDALPLAERAHQLAPRSGVIADTLGWLHFMRGDAHRARPLLQQAARLEPGVGEIRLHLAQVLAALDEMDAARTELSAALERSPELAGRPEVKALEQALSSRKR
jgi:uncharacterized protein (TIGR03790 family)